MSDLSDAGEAVAWMMERAMVSLICVPCEQGKIAFYCEFGGGSLSIAEALELMQCGKTKQFEDKIKLICIQNKIAGNDEWGDE